MSKINWSLVGAVVVMSALIVFLYRVDLAHGRDLGQWENTDPEVREWYRGLMQPDNPAASCCGEADAYWADEVHVKDGKTFATITDDRDDAPLMRPHVDIGTQIEIPDYKLKWDRGNPSGHSIVFMSRGGNVYCFVQNGGV
jgi:hypothetical protein